MSAEKTKVTNRDPLRQMLEAAEKNLLIELVENLAGVRPEVRRECFEYLKKRVDILKTPEKWAKFARQVKLDNKKRPAFQEEFARVIPDWQTL